MLAVMAGHDNSDACSVDVPVDDYLAALDRDVSGLRIGVVTSLAESPGVTPDIAACFHAAAAVLAGAGAQIREVELPHYSEVQTATTAGMAVEAFAYHRRDLQARWSDYGASTRMSIAAALMTTGADYVQAQRVRRAAVRAVTELFTAVDVVLMPCAAIPAPLLETLEARDVIPKLNTPYWSGVGNPAIAVPMGLTSDGLPVGLQIAGRPFQEATVLRVADAFQNLTDHHLAVPPLALREYAA
jgi:aspartyl-tRNA(Asn)/glutamyl-tRNA(Gln) amidotransferase subunit A